uniref:Uncharacterized protein n=1 Tax=Coptotermes formosanus TaxID=36987 RepID=R4V531_COPFO|nr:hypothetical protein [Coptotermes formosanus]
MLSNATKTNQSFAEANKKLKERIVELESYMADRGADFDELTDYHNRETTNELANPFVLELKNQIEKYKEQLRILTEKNQELNIKAANLLRLEKEFAKLKEAKANLEEEIKILKQALEREKEISDKKIRTNKAETEEEATKRIQEISSKYETIIRDLYMVAHSYFKTPIPTSSINKNDVREMLHTAGNSYNNSMKILDSLRQRLSLVDNYSIQNAVEDLIAKSKK